MKVAHWSFFNGSGLTNVATDMAVADTAMGINVVLCDTNNSTTWEKGWMRIFTSSIPIFPTNLPSIKNQGSLLFSTVS